DLLRSQPCSTQGRQQQRREDGDDGNDDQQFEQSVRRVSWRCFVEGFHSMISLFITIGLLRQLGYRSHLCWGAASTASRSPSRGALRSVDLRFVWCINADFVSRPWAPFRKRNGKRARSVGGIMKSLQFFGRSPTS